MITTDIRGGVTYAGNGIGTTFDVPWRVDDATHLQVLIVDDATGVETAAIFEVDDLGTPSASVVLATPAAAGETVLILPQPPATQTANLRSQRAFNPEVVERALDRAVLLAAGLPSRSMLIDLIDAAVVRGIDAVTPAFSNFVADSFTATDGQTEFALTDDPGVIANLDVSVNGEVLQPGTDYGLLGQQVSLALPRAAGDKVLIRYGRAFSQQGAAATEMVEVAVAAGATQVTIPGSAAASGQVVLVFYNGVAQHPSAYTTAGAVIQFSEALPDGGTVAALVTNITANNVAAGNISFTRSATGAVSVPLRDKLGEVVSVKDFGAVGDGVADDTAAIQAACDDAVLRAPARVFFPEGSYRITDEIDLYRDSSPRVDIVLEGTDQLTSMIVGDFTGADKALFRCVDPAEDSRASPVSIRNLHFKHADSSAPGLPVFVDLFGLGESRLEGLRFNATNNTVMRVASAQNVRMRDIVSFNGGHHYLYKSTAGITFDATSGGSTITASIPVFSADDVGKIISIYPSNEANRIKYVIGGYTSPTEVTVSGTTTLEAVDATGTFEPARASMTSGSAILTANAPCFTAADVGRVVYVRRARAGSWGDALLRGQIIAYTNSTTVELDVAADNTVTEEPFGVPTIDFWRPMSGGVADDSNDVKVDLLHVENYKGIGVVLQKTIFFHLTNFKVHGEVTPTDTQSSLAHLWLDDHAGDLSGELDGACMGDARIYLCNFNDMSTVHWLATRRTRQETIFKSELFTDAGGYLNVSNLNTYTAPAAGPAGLVVDANYLADPTDPRIVFSGFVNMLGDAQKARHYVGRGTYFDPRGRMTTDLAATNQVLASTVAWTGTPPSGTEDKRYSWQQVGNVVFFSVRLEYSVAGATNTGVSVTLPAGMPAPADLTGSGTSELKAFSLSGYMATAAAGAVPSLSKAYAAGDGLGGVTLNAALNSGSVSAAIAVFSGFYFTNA